MNLMKPPLLAYIVTSIVCIHASESPSTKMLNVLGDINHFACIFPRVSRFTHPYETAQKHLLDSITKLPQDGLQLTGTLYLKEFPFPFGPRRCSYITNESRTSPGAFCGQNFIRIVTYQPTPHQQDLFYPKEAKVIGMRWHPNNPHIFYHAQDNQLVYEWADDANVLAYYFSGQYVVQKPTYPQMVMVYLIAREASTARTTVYIQDIISAMNRRCGAPGMPVTDMAEWARVQRTLPREIITALNRVYNVESRRP